MQSLLDLFPLVAFAGAYFTTRSIYVATSVLMGSMALLLMLDYARMRRIPTLHAVSTVLVFAFGAATLILHNQRFIQWKPTVFFWLLSVALLASMWIGEQPLAQRLLSPALEGQSKVSRAIWRRLNMLWVAFYALLGALNLLVAFNTSEATWVKFKVIGLTVATFVFTASQLAWLIRRPTAATSP